MCDKEDLERVKNARTVAKRTFTRKCNLFEEATGEKYADIVLTDMCKEVCDAFTRVEKCHEEYVDLLVRSGEEESVIVDAEKYIDDLEKRKLEVLAIQRRFCRAKDAEKDKSDKLLKVKSIQPPVFNGELRAYPTFKDDYKRLMESSFHKDPYALRSCLSGPALDAVQGVENDYDEMFNRLDEKFGDSCKLVDTVLCDLKSIKPIDERDIKGFVRMVEKFERCWLDMKRMNLESEMNTVNMVSFVEKIMPGTQRREWVIWSEKYRNSKHLFEKLMEFLLREKRVLEYMDSSVRSYARNKTCHNAVGEVIDEGKDDGINLTIKKLQEDQSEIRQCLHQLTQSVHDLGKVRGDSEQSQYQGIRCWLHGSYSHSIHDCKEFVGMSSSDKIEAVKRNRVCFSCLNGSHVSKRCWSRRTCNVITTAGQRCGKDHHPLLHEAYVEGLMFHMTLTGKLKSRVRDKTLLMMNKLYSANHSTPLNTLWDPGSDITLVRFDTASKLGFKGKEVTLSITKVGGKTERMLSREYVIPLTDMDGKIWHVTAYGIENITSNVCKVDITEVVKLFEGITVTDFDLPVGNIDLLIGTDWCNLMPQVISSVGSLQLMQSMFGYCIRGSHPLIRFQTQGENAFGGRINHVACSRNLGDISVDDVSKLKLNLEKFFEIEGLGTYCVPKCGGCKCGSCAIGDENYSIKEERELALISAGLKHNPEEKCWSVTYPWIKEPKDLPNNVSVAVSRLKTTERRLCKLGAQYSGLYNDQIQDMVNRGVAKRLSIKELNDYEGPVHYIHHHEVLKPSSSSTPLRIVFNSSASYVGHRLNDYWAKGPDVLNNLLGILIRFRQGKFAITGDISKMYNSVKMGTLDQHTHRFLWRNMDINRPPDHYVMMTVTFGDKPSGVIAMTALKKTVEMYETRFPKVKDVVSRNSYVDDIVHSCDDVYEAQRLANHINLVLSEGGFKIKHWVMSGDETMNANVKLLDSREEKVLGLKWDPKEDTLGYKVELNFSKKFRNVREGPCLTRSNLECGIPENLTKRIVLSQAAAVYDPLGLISPFTLNPKLLMREIVTSERTTGTTYGWDDVLPDRLREKWCKFFQEMFELEHLTFARCVKPNNAVGDPMLIIFSDGSSLAYGACAYIRWELDDGRFETRLIMAKNRIAPIKQMTTPRLELCGAVLSCRLRLAIEKESDWSFHSVLHIVDSSIVRAQIQKESYGFGTFVANRVAEIQAKTDPNDWWWVSTNENPADLTTRPCHPNYLRSNSLWQRGPDFLSNRISEWPLSKLCNEELPDRINVTLMCESAKEEESESRLIKVERYSSYNKLLRVVARVLEAVKIRSFKGALFEPTPDKLREAEKYLIRVEQKAFQPGWERDYRRLGPNMNSEGIIVVGERMSRWLKDNWNQDLFILMPSRSQVVKLYIKHLHEIDHGGIEKTLAKLQSKFWIPAARRLIKKIKRECIMCRKLDAVAAGQRMGEVCSERLKPAPPFYYTSLDLFGPFAIKDTVKRRTVGKAYGVIFSCLVTRAVFLDLADSYNTQSFLTAFRRFVSVRGYPHTIHSDSGTQLVAASKELKMIRQNWDVTEIMQSSVNKGTTWVFNKSAEAPWQNGCSEALIKAVKRALTIAIGDSKLTFGELQTVLFDTANLLNDRPIGMKPGVDVEMGSYLCPNDLLLGRTNNRTPTGTMMQEQYGSRCRLMFMDQIVNSFWKKWHRDYFPTLIVRQKWHVERRNIRPGDIVLLQDQDARRGQWRLAQVKSLKPSRDDKVRDVIVRYKIKRPGRVYTGQDDICVSRSVHKLVVILPVEEMT